MEFNESSINVDSLYIHMIYGLDDIAMKKKKTLLIR
jgi:hypothetical protein